MSLPVIFPCELRRSVLVEHDDVELRQNLEQPFLRLLARRTVAGDQYRKAVLCLQRPDLLRQGAREHHPLPKRMAIGLQHGEAAFIASRIQSRYRRHTIISFASRVCIPYSITHFDHKKSPRRGFSIIFHSRLTNQRAGPPPSLSGATGRGHPCCCGHRPKARHRRASS